MAASGWLLLLYPGAMPETTVAIDQDLHDSPHDILQPRFGSVGASASARYAGYDECVRSSEGPKSPREITAFTKAWKTACIAAGCPGRIPHDLRRTAIRNMVRRSIPDAVAMKLAGHKTRSVFDRYNVVSDSDLRTAASQLLRVLCV